MAVSFQIAQALCEVVGMVLLHCDRTGFNQSLCHEAAWHQQGLAHIYGESPQVVTKAGEYFCEQLRHVDVALSDGREYLMGSQFTTADILLTTCLTWAIDYGVGIGDSAAPYLERVTSRAGYRAGETANFAQI